MTEITAHRRSLLLPEPRPIRNLIDPVAFVLAMVGGPILVTLLSFWVVFIPVVALIMGGPLFLLIGTPVLLWHLSYHPPMIDRISLLAFLTVLFASAPILPIALLWRNDQLLSLLMLFGGFGLIFAPVWGMATGWIYVRLRRDFYSHPLSS